MKTSLNKTENIQVRVQKPVKDQVDIILEELGLTTSQAVNIFFKQIISKKGLPFSVSLDYDPVPLSLEEEKMISQSIRGERVVIDPNVEGELENYLEKLENV